MDAKTKSQDSRTTSPFTTSPFGATAAMGYDAWRKAMEDQLQRFTELHDELRKHEAAGAERARTAIREGARLLEESLQWTGQLLGAWHDQLVEAGRRTVARMTPDA